MDSPSSIWWLILGVVLVIIEISTFNMLTVWFAAGALGALIVSLLGVPLPAQLSVFALLSAVLIVLTKPFVQKLTRGKETPTNADMVIGQRGIVIEDIDPVNVSGQVKVKGAVWTALCDRPLAKGTEITVLEIKGVKLLVKETQTSDCI